MAKLGLVIGDYNLSSWSLRPWFTLKLLQVPFDETRIRLRRPDTKQQILAHSPAGKVPILKDGNLVVWDSLAIQEYLAEKFPDAGLWPADSAARALARSAAAEMHSGFAALREDLPMECHGARPRQPGPQAQADIARITGLWNQCRASYGRGGDFLFGRPGIADAMYAPVTIRFRIYGVALDPVSAAYCAAMLNLPAMQEWFARARAELTESSGR